MFKSTTFISALIALILMASCSTPKDIAYFQDLVPDSSQYVIKTSGELRLQPGDKISIMVNTDKAQLTDMFNLPYVTRQLGRATTSNSTYGNSTSQGVSCYTLDSNGDIDFPVVGKIHVAGMTRQQVATTIKNRLVTEDLVKQPVVTVEFMNLTIDILGEVKVPGRYNIDKDQVTILEAISLAGDLTITGKRDKVLVLRQEGGKQKVYGVNLLSGSDVFNSPAYHLQQGDVVYVEPNDKRTRESTVNGNNLLSTSFWVSVGSLVVSILALVNSM